MPKEHLRKGGFDAPDECAAVAARGGAPSSLPADGVPGLDLLADYHLTAEVRLFAS